MMHETERLILRDFTMDDWEQVHDYASGGALARFME